MGRGRTSLNLIRVVPVGIRYHCALAQARTVPVAPSTILLRSPYTHNKQQARFLSTQSTAAGSLHTQSKSHTKPQSQAQSQSQASTSVLDELSRQANAILISKYSKQSEVERDAQLLLTSTLCSDPLVRALYNSSPGQQETIKLLHRAFLRITSLSLSHNSPLSLSLARRARLFGLSLHLPLYQDLLLQAASAATSSENNDNNDPDLPSPSATILEMASIACQSHQVTLDAQFFTASLLKLIHRHLFEEATIVLNAMAERHGIVPLPTETTLELMLALQRNCQTFHKMTTTTTTTKRPLAMLTLLLTLLLIMIEVVHRMPRTFSWLSWRCIQRKGLFRTW
ncbi:hypothetical protein MHU86_8759 [Fragilaria crotonensis]|nr:hypothetical protein MHU86_8759 [Fragilaria crotonensis]